MNSKFIAFSVILVVLFSLQMLCISCRESGIGKNAKITFKETDTQNIFISHVIYAPENTEHKLISHLQNQYLPVWRKLKDENILYELSVFKLKKTGSTTTDRHLCNYLILAHLYSGVKPNEFLNAEKLAKNPNSDKNSLFQIQRTEILHCTQNAYFPALNSEKKTRTTDIVYLLEFIVVKDSVNYVNQYHALMQKYFGPLNGVLVNEGKLHSIFMLETAEVLFQRNNRFNWNQLHISGDFPEFVDLNWDSLYTDLFRRTFSCELDSVWALLPPIMETSFDCTGKLIQDLQVK